MSEPEQLAQVEQVDPGQRCYRCRHPWSDHTGPGTLCEAELSPTSVPSIEKGGTCPCTSFVHAPAPAPPPEPEEPEEPELLDGPLMYAEGLGYLRSARAADSAYREDTMLAKAQTYFAAASAAALAQIAADNETKDNLVSRRWQAALAGEAELPEVAPA
jgi:hypothetical protein